MKIYPKRITQARELRGLNITELSTLMEVTRQSISYYEQGKRIPKDTIIKKISKELKVPVEFFYTKEENYQRNSATFFRTLKTSTAKSRTAIQHVSDITYKGYIFLEDFVNLPKLDLPFLEFFLLNDNLSDDLIEKISEETRSHWNLGDNPIVSMVNLLESKGIVIGNGKLIVNKDKTDACYSMIEDNPVIVLGEKETMEGSSFRQNFSLAHELGHILLHSHITDVDIENKDILNQIEREANYFASCFLMPRQSFMDSVYSTSLDFFLLLKEKWHVSIAAMIYRCHDLHLITDEENLNLRKQISFRKWRTIEPLDKENPINKPQLFFLSLKLLFNSECITPSDFRNHMKLEQEELETIFSLPNNFLSDKTHEIKLTLI